MKRRQKRSQIMLPPSLDVKSCQTGVRVGLAALALLTLFGCAHYKIRPLPDSTGPGMLRSSKSAIDLSVLPPEEKAADYSAFDADLRRSGIFPVFVRVDNHSEREVAVNRITMTLSDQRQTFAQLGPDQVSDRLEFSPTARYFAWSFGLFGIGIIPGVVDGYNAVSANRTMRQDMSEKLLRNRTLPPGGFVMGFLFFDVPETLTPTRFSARITIGADAESLSFVFDLTRS